MLGRAACCSAQWRAEGSHPAAMTPKVDAVLEPVLVGLGAPRRPRLLGHLGRRADPLVADGADPGRAGHRPRPGQRAAGRARERPASSSAGTGSRSATTRSRCTPAIACSASRSRTRSSTASTTSATPLSAFIAPPAGARSTAHPPTRPAGESPARRFEAVIFDLDGVLVDAEIWWDEVRIEFARASRADLDRGRPGGDHGRQLVRLVDPDARAPRPRGHAARGRSRPRSSRRWSSATGRRARRSSPGPSRRSAGSPPRCRSPSRRRAIPSVIAAALEALGIAESFRRGRVVGRGARRQARPGRLPAGGRAAGRRRRASCLVVEDSLNGVLAGSSRRDDRGPHPERRRSRRRPARARRRRSCSTGSSCSIRSSDSAATGPSPAAGPCQRWDTPLASDRRHATRASDGPPDPAGRPLPARDARSPGSRSGRCSGSGSRGAIGCRPDRRCCASTTRAGPTRSCSWPTLPWRPRLYFFGPKEEDMSQGGRNRLMTWTGTAVPFKPAKNDLLEATRRVGAVFDAGGGPGDRRRGADPCRGAGAPPAQRGRRVLRPALRRPAGAGGDQRDELAGLRAADPGPGRRADRRPRVDRPGRRRRADRTGLERAPRARGRLPRPASRLARAAPGIG